MKNVKRWLALGMAAMMTAGVLAGCGSTSTDTASDSSESTAAKAQQQKQQKQQKQQRLQMQQKAQRLLKAKQQQAPEQDLYIT